MTLGQPGGGRGGVALGMPTLLMRMSPLGTTHALDAVLRLLDVSD